MARGTVEDIWTWKMEREREMEMEVEVEVGISEFDVKLSVRDTI